MNRIDRWAWWMAVACLLAALGRPAAAQSLAGLPDGADIVACVSLASGRGNPDFKRRLNDLMVKTGQQGDAGMSAMIRNAGINLETDVDTFALAVYYGPPTPGSTEPMVDIVAVSRGRFDTAKAMAAIQQGAAQEGMIVSRSEMQGTPMLGIRENTPVSRETLIGFPGAREVLMASSPDLMSRSMASLKNAAAAPLKPELQGLLGQVDRAAIVWAAGRPSPSLQAMSGAMTGGQPGAPAAGPRDFTFSLDSAQGLAVKLDVGFADAAGAQMFQQQAGLFSAMAMMTINNAQITMDQKLAVNQALAKLASEARGTRAVMSLSLNPAEFEAVSAALDAMVRGGAAPAPVAPAR